MIFNNMNNINKIKVILFATLLVVMILPFSNIEMIDAIKDNKTEEVKMDKTKKEKRDPIKGNGYTKKDFKNYEAEKILEELMPYLLITSEPEESNILQNQKKIEKIQQLQKQFDKAKNDHKERIIDKELREDLKKDHTILSKSDIPYKTIATGIDYVYIQLPIDMSEKESIIYETQIAELLTVPYLLEYGEGIKRGSCVSTESDCSYEVGGIKIQIPTSPDSATSCTLSIPMMKDGFDGFLTAAHCFNEYSGLVYQPDTSQVASIIGISDSTWQSFEEDGECDCAWIIDTSPTQQRTGVFAIPNYYYAITQTHIPSIGEGAMLRGYHNNNGAFYLANEIDYDDITIDDGINTYNAMSFESPFQPGDSGGTVFSAGNKYIGIAVGYGMIDGTLHTVFIPWDHITENISGLELKPHH